MVNCQPKIEEFDIVRHLSIKAFLFLFDHCEYSKAKKEQIIHGYPLDGAMVRKLSIVCLHNNAFVARGIWVNDCIVGHPNCISAPSILLVLLEPHCKYFMQIYLS